MKFRVAQIVMSVTLLMLVLTNTKLNVRPTPPTAVTTTAITLPDGNQVNAELNTPPQDTQGWIGANLTDLTPTIKTNLNYSDAYGVYVHDTYVDSPAQVAGLLPGDIITQVNNVDAVEVLPTLMLIASLHPGNVYPFTVFRHGKYLDYSITITHKQHFS